MNHPLTYPQLSQSNLNKQMTVASIANFVPDSTSPGRIPGTASRTLTELYYIILSS
jgi:hypothetical protein